MPSLSSLSEACEKYRSATVCRPGSITRPATVYEIHLTVVLAFTYNGASLEHS